MAYERRVIAHLREVFGKKVEYHQWIEFDDKNGIGFCEPECFVVLPDKVLLVECKRTGSTIGRAQMIELYAPLLNLLLGLPIQMLQICKHVTSATPGPFIEDLDEFVQSKTPYATWHLLL